MGLKITVIGGGSSYTPELIDGFIKRKDELDVSEIHLVDIAEGKEKLKIVSDLSRRMIAKANMKTKIVSTLNLEEAIKGSDFVLTQFRVGGLKARAKDEMIPLKYDLIGQETTGAGGFAKALRTIPVIMDICNCISRLAPDAWLINFTNPAGLITEAVQKYTNVKVIGLCNVPIGMVNNVAKLMEVKPKRISIEFAGLNHLVWGKKVYLDGEDITEGVIDKLSEGGRLTMENIPDLKWESGFLKAMEMIPCPYHRYYYRQREMLREEKESFNKNRTTRATQVMDIEKILFKTYENPLLTSKPAELEKRGGAFYSDAAVSLVSAIYNDKEEIHTVNIKNHKTINGLPEDAVIECNAVIDKNGARPIKQTGLPESVMGLTYAVKTYESLTIEAVVKKSYNLGLQALMAHPLVQDSDTAELLLKDILGANERYVDLH